MTCSELTTQAIRNVLSRQPAGTLPHTELIRRIDLGIETIALLDEADRVDEEKNYEDTAYIS